jgi:hypothetical protein
VDGNAGPLLADIIERHLLTCESCASEVASLRRVRDRLGSAAKPGSADGELTTRLVSIAGTDADRPLALRAGQGPMPTRVQARRRLAAAGVLFTLAAFLAFSGIGLTAAPPLLRADELSDADQADFAAVLNRSPLTLPAAVAVLAIGPTAVGSSATSATSPSFRVTSPMSQPAAVLTRAVAQQTWSRGEAQVTVRVSDGYRTTTMTVKNGSDGSTVEMRDSTGVVTHHGFLPRYDVTLPDWLAAGYTLAGWADAGEVAGRASSVVQASLPNRVVARWWLDDVTGSVLRQERYAPDGSLTLAAEYLSFSSTAAAAVAQGASLLPAGDSAMSSDQECPDGWSCEESLHGLPLVWRAADQASDPAALQSVYSDGITTVAVRQRRGTLSDAPSGFVRGDAGFGTDRVPATVMWQSGPYVYTVSTTDCLTSARQVAAQLPHDAGVGPGVGSRVIAGWASLLGRL